MCICCWWRMQFVLSFGNKPIDTGLTCYVDWLQPSETGNTHFFLSFGVAIDLKRRRRRQRRWKWGKNRTIKRKCRLNAILCSFAFLCFALDDVYFNLYFFFFLRIQLTALVCHPSCTCSPAHWASAQASQPVSPLLLPLDCMRLMQTSL